MELTDYSSEFKDIRGVSEYGIASLWLMQMWASSTTVGIITLLLVSVGCLAGHIALFTGHVAIYWSALFTGCIFRKLVTLLVSLYG